MKSTYKNLTRQWTTRIDTADDELTKQIASARGMGLSSYIRKCVFDENRAFVSTNPQGFV